jgi:hypothetical protein
MDGELIGVSLIDPLKERKSLMDKINERPETPVSEQFITNFEKQYTMSNFMGP